MAIPAAEEPWKRALKRTIFLEGFRAALWAVLGNSHEFARGKLRSARCYCVRVRKSWFSPGKGPPTSLCNSRSSPFTVGQRVCQATKHCAAWCRTAAAACRPSDEAGPTQTYTVLRAVQTSCSWRRWWLRESFHLGKSLKFLASPAFRSGGLVRLQLIHAVSRARVFHNTGTSRVPSCRCSKH